ncbi:peptidase family m13 domain-containing protein [Ditylenchus destructor]|nr:peptidase family m13 domain-containing protein [Ditylenchus destructor]
MSNDGQPENQEETEKLRREMEEDPYKFMNYISIDEIKHQGLTSIDQMFMVTFPLKDLKEYDDMILSLPPQAMSDYLEWFIILNHVSILDDRYRAFAMDFVRQNMPARVDCKTQTFKYFPHQGDRLYAEAFFPEDVRTSVTDLFDYIDEAFGDMLEEVDWMDDDTRDEALDKLDAMEIHMGYVDEIFDDERIEEIYGGYDLRAGMSYVEMIAMMDEWRAKYGLEKLAETLPFYNSGSQTINAFYAHDRNLFFAMMSHLQGLFYTQDRPTVMNIGAIGFVLAHEVTHGFDHQGSKHDASGTIRDWWDPETKQSFNEEKQCIIDQYSNYIFKLNETYSQPLDGVLMQGENIADHGGIRAAYKAWQYFLDDVEDGLAFINFMKTFFPEDIRTSVTDLFDYIDEAFGDMLEEVDWMDDDTRDEALDKLDAMEIHMGYVDEVFDDERIEEIYEGYDLRAGMSYMEMIAMMDEWRAKYELEELAQEPPFYQSAIVDINAAYYPDRNAIFAMMSILQGPYYTKGRPTVMNFAVIGAVLGHEITHGFDHQGSRHDVDGNLRDWWDPETKENFNEEKQCIVDQYSNYIFKLNETYSQPLDGVLMQGENIADHGGIRAAYKAWQYFLDDVEDGLAEDPSETYSIGTIEDFTDEQLFFIASGFMNCEQTSSELQYNILNNGWNDHAPGEARVNQVYRNQPEFARAFRCPRGSGMNPTQKCAVW